MAVILMLLAAITWSLVGRSAERQTETGTPPKSASARPSAPAPPAPSSGVVARNAEIAALEQLRRQELQVGLAATKDRRADCLSDAKLYTVEYLLPIELAVDQDGRAAVTLVADASVTAPSLLPTSAHACMFEVLRSIIFRPANHQVKLSVTAKLD